MSKAKTHFVCAAYGHTAAKWVGQCPGCDEWNTLNEQDKCLGMPDGAARNRFANLATPSEPVRVRDVDTRDVERMPSGISEWDRVLGGGLVRASVGLIGGEPGIGKSTLTMQALHAVKEI